MNGVEHVVGFHTMDELLLSVSEVVKGRVNPSVPWCTTWSHSGSAHHRNAVAGCRLEAAVAAYITATRWPAAEHTPRCSRCGRGSGTERNHLAGM